MSTGTANLSPGRTATPEIVPPEQFIERQLDQTRLQLKVNDLFLAMILFVAGVLVFFLTVAIIDHWILGLGFWGRLTALVTLVAGSSTYFIRVLLPLLLHRINPAYAARVIEQNSPSLKNSLLNFWLLRGTRGVVHDFVYQALGQRVATDLSQVSVESSVDRSRLFRFTWVLVGLIAISAAYKMFSPKDPLQTASRVLAPWASIDRPSRVKIEDVQPGDQKVFHGQMVTVSARITVHGVGDPGPVTLLYTTADGQVIDRAVPLASSKDGLRHECQLPPSGSGVQQDIVYRLTAGDTLTPDFKLIVLPAPTILVERIDYDFPAYTAKPRQSMPRHGDIAALEGTRVTVFAKANHSIQSAYIEFDPARGARGAKDAPASANNVLPMKVSDHEASASFVLELTADRKTPQHAAYQVRFVNTDGFRNEQPIVNQIEVMPDLPPEVEILTPEKDKLDVPESGRQKIEIRGVDPDFGLSKITLRAVNGGNDLLTHELLAESKGRPGQAVVSYEFVPRELKLSAGDEVTYWAVVEDNRVGPRSGLPEPNSQRTRNYLIRVAKGDEPRKQPDKDESGDKNDNPQAGDKKDQNDQPQAKDPRDDSPDNNNKKQKNGDKGDQPDSSDAESPKDQDAKNQKQGGGGSKNQPQDKGNQKKNGKPDGAGGQSGQGNSNDKQKGDPEESGGEAGTAGEPNGAKPKGNSGAGGKPNSPQTSNERPESGDSPPESDSKDPSSNDNAQPGSGSPKNGGSGGKPARDLKPGESTGDPAGQSGSDSSNLPREQPHDGEVIEKALEHLRQQQAKNKGGANDDQSSQPKSGDPQGADPRAGKPKASDPQPGEKPDDKTNSDPSASDPRNGAKQSADKNGGQAGQPGKPGEKPEQDPEGKKGDAAEQPGQKPNLDQKQGEAPRNSKTADNPGGKPEGPAETKSGDKPLDKTADNKPAGGQGDNGEAGAGQKSKDDRGSPEAQDKNQDRKKPTDPAGTKPSEKEDATSPSNSKKQSDSQSDSSGTESGGGQKGGGQGANQKGNDSAGSNSAADEGAGQSNDPGQGDASGQPGNKKKSPGKTGQKGREPGAGSDTRPQEGGNTSPKSPDEKSGQPGSGDAGAKSSQPPPAGVPQTTAGGGQPTGGGGVESNNINPNTAPPPPTDGTGGDAANLEFARRATDLALEHLKDQKDNPDRELLDKLGWTKEDLQKFIERWEALKRSAAEKDADGKRDLDETLRSLGLRPSRDKKRAGGGPNDTIRGNRDAGGRSGPPAKYREQFDAFRKGASRSSDK